MKKLFTIFLFTVCINAKGQTTNDSLLSRIKNDEKIILEMSNNIAYCHSEFRTGTIISAIGMLGAIGTAVILKSDSYQNARNIGFIASSVLIFSGCIVMIDSHKFLGDAGSVSVSPNGLKISYGF
jgi:hypothetical protein